LAENLIQEQHENTVWLWRVGKKMARRRRAPDWQRDYNAAINAAVTVLQRYQSMDALVTAYYHDRVDDWLEPLCRRSSRRELNVGIVQDAAYWQRLLQLLGVHVQAN